MNLIKFSILSVFFVLNPLITLITNFLFFFPKKLSSRNEFSTIKFLSICSVLFISIINSTRLPDSDLLVYINEFLLVDKISFSYYIILGESEFIFSIINWLIFKLTTGSEFWFKFIHSILIYGILNFANYRLCKALGVGEKLTLVALIFLNFNPYTFVSSLHLLRQFLAGSIIFLAIVEKFFYDRKIFSYVLVALAVLIHNTTLFFIPFLFFKWTNSVDKLKSFLSLIALAVIISYYQLIVKLALNISFISNSIFGAFLVRSSQDTQYDLGFLELKSVILLIFLLISCFYFLFFSKKQLIKKSLNKLGPALKILFFLCFIILVNYSQSEFSVRFNFYCYLFLTLILLMYVIEFKFAHTISFPISFLVIFYWIFYLDISKWDFELPSNLFITPLFVYFDL